MDGTSITALVGRLLNARTLGFRRTNSPDVYLVDLADRCVVAKSPGYINRPGATLVEAWVYMECARRGVRVPKVLAVSEDPECLVVERLSGAPLPPDTLDQHVWASAGADLRTVHEIAIAGFGPLTPGHHDPVGTSATWCPFVDFACTSGIPWLVDHDFLEGNAGNTLVRRLADAQPALAQWADGRLLHGDLECGHLFRLFGGRYGGMVDFGQAQSGDPRWDLARIRLWDGDAALDALLDGYGREAVTREERRDLLPIYLLALVTHHAVGHDQPGYIRLLLRRSGYEGLL